MTRLEQELYALGRANAAQPRSEAVERAVLAAGREFYAAQSRRQISYFDFLLTQMRIIQKRWWLLQAALLAVLWYLLSYGGVLPEIRRVIHAIVPLFTIAAAPELWKNLRCGSTEIEGAAYFTLREIYSARLTVFAAVDLSLLSIFCLLALRFGRIEPLGIILELLLPFTVTCCICFRVLCSRRFRSETLAVALCLLWTALWSNILVREELYSRLSLPVWALLLLLCAAYLGLCISRFLKNTKWSDNLSWNLN